jgi:hypothetical protein
MSGPLAYSPSLLVTTQVVTSLGRVPALEQLELGKTSDPSQSLDVCPVFFIERMGLHI